jgi:hypothetical protein
MDDGLCLHPSLGQIKATVTKPVSTSPPLTTDGVDKIYRQLVEIHIIVAMLLVECVHWRQSGSAPSPVRAGTGWQRPTMTASAVILAPSPPTDFPS